MSILRLTTFEPGERFAAYWSAAGRVEFGIEYRHVPWEGDEVGANDRAGYVEVDEGCAHFAFGL